MPLVLLLPFAGAVTAVIAVLVGLPALRVRGLYLAVSTLAFSLWFMQSVLATPCWTLPLLGTAPLHRPPDPQSTLLARPSSSGIGLDSERAFAWFCLAILVATVGMVMVVARPRGGPPACRRARQRDRRSGPRGPPRPDQVLAFALSGFIAGYAGVCLAFATERISTATFDPTLSILVVSMVVIGGIDSVAGAVLGALYLVGLPALLGTTPTIQFLTSGLGLLAFILYLPGGLAQLLHRFGDLVADGVIRLRRRGVAWHPGRIRHRRSRSRNRRPAPVGVAT